MPPASSRGTPWPPRRRDAPRLLIVLIVLGLTGSAVAPPAWSQTPLDPANPRSPIYVPPPEPEVRPVVGWASARSSTVRYELPGAGEILRPFEPGPHPFGPAHRGVDIEAGPGSPVAAAADGTVRHAGTVAGTVWVSVVHADGLITSYGPVADLAVEEGQDVRRGQLLGSLAAGGHGAAASEHGLHFGVRRGSVYIDPLRLLDLGIPRPSLVGHGQWRGTAHVVTPYEAWSGDRFGGWGTTPSPDADRPGFSVPPSPNHLIMLNGLATSSSQRPFDPAHLGYDPRSVTQFSYAGRRGRPGQPADPRRDQRSYGPEDTWDGVEPAADRLAAQLRAQAIREPGRAVDLVGHSMGGVVILHYLSHLHDAYDPTLPPIGRVVTIASPHRGSDTAAGVGFLREHPVISPTIDLVRGFIRYPDGSTARDHLPLDAPAIDQLRTGSRFVEQHGRAWVGAVDQDVAGPLAMGTQVLAIGGSRDVVVAPGNARPPTTPLQDHPTREHRRADAQAPPVASHTVLPGGHGSVLDTEAIRETTWRFLAGQEPVRAGGGLSAVAADELGPMIHVGSAMLYLYGGFVAGVRRLARSPTSGPIEPDRSVDDHEPPDQGAVDPAGGQDAHARDAHPAVR